ncbi:MAG TPA: ATP-binding protein [Gammaproteobacteria bacterium]|jgi:hypothetical protein
MDPRLNPYAPGAGTPPPDLVGRDELIERASIALDRIRAGRAARSLILYGLRGVGKTVLLNKIRLDAEANGMVSVKVEAPEDRSLPAILAPSLRSALLRISRGEALKDNLLTGMRALASFTKALKIKYQDIECGIDAEPLLGSADSGDLNTDLSDLLLHIGRAAKERGTAVILYIDELQYVKEDQLEALIAALHSTSQDQLPITMVAAGLPQLLGQMGRAKSYAERLFEFVPIGQLDDAHARAALEIPAGKENVEYEKDAVDAILRETEGYPYFLQEWGKHCWNIAQAPNIRAVDASRATTDALAELDTSFFRVRFDRLTPAEKRYMRAMAELGPGPHRSGDIAEILDSTVSSVAPTRSSLITKGMIFSPAYGDTAFTVPLFDGYMKRIMPKYEAR